MAGCSTESTPCSFRRSSSSCTPHSSTFICDGSPVSTLKQRVVILGATGSIGRQALDVIDRYPDRFEVLGLVAGRRAPDRSARFVIQAGDPDCEARTTELVTHPDCGIVLVAIPGAGRLAPTPAPLDA